MPKLSESTLRAAALLLALRFLESSPDVGIVGPRIRLLDGKLDQACRRSFKTPSTYIYKWTGISRLFPRSRRFGRYYLYVFGRN
jgi:N-acetylglucosaminyl-diphospho-decaprenol L-rhamnosyltransferase